jgi:hypothetical protein
MGAFHSNTDRTHVDSNYAVSLTVAFGKGETDLEYSAESIQTTPCGQQTLVRAKVLYVAPEPLFDEESWKEEAVAQVNKGRLPPMIPSYPRAFPHVIGPDGVVLSLKEYRSICGIEEDNEFPGY